MIAILAWSPSLTALIPGVAPGAVLPREVAPQEFRLSAADTPPRPAPWNPLGVRELARAELSAVLRGAVTGASELSVEAVSGLPVSPRMMDARGCGAGLFNASACFAM